MIWTYLHHVILHFPIVLLPTVAGIGLYAVGKQSAPLYTLLRVVSWVSVGFMLLAMISGWLSAPGHVSPEQLGRLEHHRDLALTVGVVGVVAGGCVERGARSQSRDWWVAGVGFWCIAAFGILGVGHWGGSMLNADLVPF